MKLNEICSKWLVSSDINELGKSISENMINVYHYIFNGEKYKLINIAYNGKTEQIKIIRHCLISFHGEQVYFLLYYS